MCSFLARDNKRENMKEKIYTTSLNKLSPVFFMNEWIQFLKYLRKLFFFFNIFLNLIFFKKNKT